MKIQRRYTQAGQSPYAGIELAQRTSEIRNTDGSTVFKLEGIEVPATWSQVAVDILAQKYFRKAGVPQVGADGQPLVGDDGKPVLGGERDARQVFHRLAGCWTQWGHRNGYFESDDDAQAFHDELCHMLATQVCAPNSPQWFNTGLHYAYGITGPAQGHWYVDPKTRELRQASSAYERPQPHACQPYDALVSTPQGPIPIGEIVERKLVGLEVYDGRDGGRGTTRVVAVQSNGQKPVFRIVLRTGPSVEATGDHLVWAVARGRGAWLRVDEILPGMRMVTSSVMRTTAGAARRAPAARAGETSASSATLDVDVSLREVAVFRVEPIGTMPVFDIQTESGQYLSNDAIVHNCFIQAVSDDLVNDGGIMDLWTREARLFKYGSGCTSGDSRVYVSDAGLVPIRDLYARFRDSGRRVREFDGKGRYIEVTDAGLLTLSVNPDTGVYELDLIDKVWQYEVAADDKLTVRFDSGAQATVSAWHPFLVWDGEQVVERRADALRQGDAVLGPNATALAALPSGARGTEEIASHVTAARGRNAARARRTAAAAVARGREAGAAVLETELVDAIAESLVRVTAVEPCRANPDFYDLTVEKHSNYLAGERGLVAIHNTGSNFSNLRGAPRRWCASTSTTPTSSASSTGRSTRRRRSPRSWPGRSTATAS